MQASAILSVGQGLCGVVLVVHNKQLWLRSGPLCKCRPALHTRQPCTQDSPALHTRRQLAEMAPLRLSSVWFVAASILPLVLGQQSSLVGPVEPYSPLSPSDERIAQLSQDPSLLELAAMTGDRIFIVFESLMQTAIVQEDVNVNMDCLPWLSRFPGGDIQWLRNQRDDETGECVY